MSTAIQCFAWIGLAAVVILSAVTLWIWAMWCWEKAIDKLLCVAGLIHATSFFCGVVLRTKEPRGWYAGRVLWGRYKRLRESEPDVAEEFEKQMKEDGQR